MICIHLQISDFFIEKKYQYMMYAVIQFWFGTVYIFHCLSFLSGDDKLW